jgi:hypothetical protein
VKVHRTRLLDARDVRIRDGLPVTSPARTLIDRAGATSLRQLEHMFTRSGHRKTGVACRPGGRRRARARAVGVRAHGMPPLRFSRRQVRDEPLLVIAQVAQALASASG